MLSSLVNDSHIVFLVDVETNIPQSELQVLDKAPEPLKFTYTILPENESGWSGQIFSQQNDRDFDLEPQLFESCDCLAKHEFVVGMQASFCENYVDM